MPEDAPRTLTEKLIHSHLAGGDVAGGGELELAVDQILIEDATGTMCALQFEALEVDRSAVPLAVMYVDHNTLQLDTKDMEAHRYLKSFSARFGLLYSRPGNGISHYLHLERFSRPGAVLVGADSHTSAAGAVGSLAIGAGGLEVAVAMAGYTFATAAPEIHGVELVGSLPDWVHAKDVILELLRRHGVRGGLGMIFEFFGPGVATLSATERATICNMVVETGATTAMFPSDDRVRECGSRRSAGPMTSSPSRRIRGRSTTASRRSTSPRSSRWSRARTRRATSSRSRSSQGQGPRRCASARRSTPHTRTWPSSRRCSAARPCTPRPTSRSPPGRGRSSTRSRGAASTSTSSRRVRASSSPSAGRASAWARRRQRACRRCVPSTGTSPAGAARRTTRSTSARRRPPPRRRSRARSRIRGRSAGRPR